MAIRVGDNFDYRGPKPNFDRDVVSSVSELASAAVSGGYSEGALVFCLEDKAYYSFREATDTEEARFEELKTGSEEATAVILTQAEYDALEEKENILYVIRS